MASSWPIIACRVTPSDGEAPFGGGCGGERGRGIGPGNEGGNEPPLGSAKTAACTSSTTLGHCITNSRRGSAW